MQFRTSIADLTNCHKTSVWSLWRRKSIFSSFNSSRYCLDLVHFVSPSYAIRRSHTQKIAEKIPLKSCIFTSDHIQPSEYNGVGELTLIYSPSQQWLYSFITDVYQIWENQIKKCQSYCIFCITNQSLMLDKCILTLTFDHIRDHLLNRYLLIKEFIRYWTNTSSLTVTIDVTRKSKIIIYGLTLTFNMCIIFKRYIFYVGDWDRQSIPSLKLDPVVYDSILFFYCVG